MKKFFWKITHLDKFVQIYICFVASRVNTPPVAIVKPSSQEVNEPNDLVIDGSGKLDVMTSYKLTGLDWVKHQSFWQRTFLIWHKLTCSVLPVNLGLLHLFLG